MEAIAAGQLSPWIPSACRLHGGDVAYHVPSLTLGPVCPKTALSAHMVMSHIMCRMWPPPTAYPATIATTGFGILLICVQGWSALASS